MRNVFIVAQYKCGTSWLLSALSAHPSVVGIREVDIVKGTFEWRQGTSMAPVNDRLEAFFGSSAWCPDDVREALEDQSLPDGHVEAADFNRPQSYKDLPPAVLYDLYRKVRGASQPKQVVDSFVEAVASQANSESHLVLKAADQIAVLDLLDSVRPDSAKIAITRDGRDAAISALHYKKLAQHQPWFSGNASYMDLLKGWAGRAQILADAAEEGRLHVIRYEDLTNDYMTTMSGLLRMLDLDDSASVIEEVNRRTSFEAMTGRERGTEGVGVIRKGGVGEWQETLSLEEARAAWDIAGDALSRFGYTLDGEARDLPDPFRSEENR